MKRIDDKTILDFEELTDYEHSLIFSEFQERVKKYKSSKWHEKVLDSVQRKYMSDINYRYKLTAKWGTSYVQQSE